MDTATGCQGKNKRGGPCGAPPYKDGYCYVHHPGIAAERDAKRRKGGENSANAVRAQRRMIIAKPYDVHVVLGTALHDVFRGDLDPGTAAALATLGRATLLAIEKSDLEKRIAELERRAGLGEEGQG